MKELIKMADLPAGQLAMWQNNRGTWVLFYKLDKYFGTPMVRILWTSSGNPVEYSTINDDWMCKPLDANVSDKAKDECEKINVPVEVLTEVMRNRLCPRPNMDDDRWVSVVECMPETVRFAEKWFANADYDAKPFMKEKERRESKGLKMVSFFE